MQGAAPIHTEKQVLSSSNGQFAYMQSSALLCGLQPRPGMNYSGGLLTEMGFKHMADSFLKTFIEDVRNLQAFFFLSFFFQIQVKVFWMLWIRISQVFEYPKVLNFTQCCAKILFEIQLIGSKPILIFNLYVSFRFEISVKK